jgi:hypothetical protein
MLSPSKSAIGAPASTTTLGTQYLVQDGLAVAAGKRIMMVMRRSRITPNQ